MGANDKVDATTHGGEYTPSTEDIAFYYEGPNLDAAERRAEFTRWLDQIRAEAKAEALEEAANAYPLMLRDMVSRPSVVGWLRGFATRYKGTNDG